MKTARWSGLNTNADRKNASPDNKQVIPKTTNAGRKNGEQPVGKYTGLCLTTETMRTNNRKSAGAKNNTLWSPTGKMPVANRSTLRSETGNGPVRKRGSIRSENG